MSDVATKIIKAIANGRLDDHLAQVSTAVRARTEALTQIKAASFGIGDTVEFNHRVRPAYLRGARATIEAPMTSKGTIPIRLLVGRRRYSSMTTTYAYPATIDKVRSA
jgi:hypothetical protein